MAHNEIVFTPRHIVGYMLDEIGYVTSSYEDQIDNRIRRKHIIDNSCGDGSFLCEIVRRYFQQSIIDGYDQTMTKEENDKIFKKELETYIHGIEIRPNLVDLTKDALDQVVAEFIDPKVYGKINWDIRCADALDIHDFDGKMDYVVGNPPYCNVHHFGEKYEKYKSYSFTQGGMSDLYLLFFELGFRMLKPDGRLAYIAPDSWLTSIAGKSLRDYILSGKTNLYKIIQCGHEQVFPGVTTFPAIVIFDNKNNQEKKTFLWKTLEAYVNDICSEGGGIFWWEVYVDDAFIDGKLYLGETDELYFLRTILTNNKEKRFLVKNGFATLKDKFFTHIMWLLGWLPPELHFAIKASTGEKRLLFYPYDKEGKPKKWDDFGPELQERLLSRAKELDIDTTKPDWYLYGRTQGINDFYRYKLAVKNLIKNDKEKIDCILMSEAPGGVGVYGGLYITPSVEFENEEDFSYIDFNTQVFAIVTSKDFVDYVKLLGHHKNGGYYTFTSKELEKFLNFFGKNIVKSLENKK